MNLEPESVVQKKSTVVLKALSELISTKYKVAIKKKQNEEVLDKVANVIAIKGKKNPPVYVQQETPLNPPKSEIIRRVKLIKNLN